MKTRKLKDIVVSEIGMGCMGFSHGYGKIPEESYSIEAINKAHDFGCTFFDTAEVYGPNLEPEFFGHNEKLLAKALKPYRKEIVLATKLHVPTEEAKNGRKFIYFPEGGYEHNGNKLQTFRAGAFKVAKNAEVPIVPVAIYDSHLPFDYNSYRKVTTQVYFMEPISYEQYADMSTKEISELVKGLIEDKLEELEQNRKNNGWNMWVPKYRNC